MRVNPRAVVLKMRAGQQQDDRAPLWFISCLGDDGKTFNVLASEEAIANSGLGVFVFPPDAYTELDLDLRAGTKGMNFWLNDPRKEAY